MKLIKILCVITCLGMTSQSHAVTVSYIADGWGASDFLTLSTTTRSIAFDADANLYIAPRTNDDTGTISISKLDAANGYSTSSEFATYGTSYQGVTGLDFDGLGNMYISERSTYGDAGIIRRMDVASQALTEVRTFANHRPTGVGTDTFGNSYYTGRKTSSGSFGNVYQIDSIGTRSILVDGVVGTGIAMDNTGRLFVSTPGKTGLSLLANSIYMFDPTDLLNPVRIASFSDAPGGELTFDDAGNLYVIDNIDNLTITRLSAVPVPAAFWLFGSGLLVLLGLRKNRT